MFHARLTLLGLFVAGLAVAPLRAVAEPTPAAEPDDAPVSFMTDIAPIFVQNCIACHNPRKAESRYDMTTFEKLAKGGQMGEDITLEPGDADASYLVELVRHDGFPRMPYNQDPLPLEQVALIERWVEQGGQYDGNSPSEDWPTLLRRLTPIEIPEVYPVTVPITALAFSPDGAEIATAGYHEVNLWKTEPGTLSRRLPGTAERVYDIAYSPDGKWLATASGDPGQFGSVQLWIAEPNGGGKRIRDLVETVDSVFAVAFSPDSRLLAAGGADRAIRVWEVASGELVALIEDHADWVLDLAFSPDGARLASASRDKTSKVFDIEKKESLVTFPAHGETVYSVAFSPDSTTVATAGGDNRVRLWNPDDDAKQIREIRGFGGPVFQVRYHPEGPSLVACGADKTLRILNPADGAEIRTLTGHDDWIYSLAISPDGTTLASGSWDGQVRFWRFEDGQPTQTLVAAPGYPGEATAQAPASAGE